VAIPSGTEAARPFLPAKNFETSRAFYEALGFRQLLDGDVAIFGVGASGFILQPWWAHIEALDLPGKFGVQPPKAPAMQPWGLRVAYVCDPSGVLWHVAQRRQNAPAD
jgi:hypothetical protein